MKVHPTKAESPVIVYIDIKSPYAYLAIEPTRQLERELGIKFDWRPFVLDIPSYLGSAKLDKSGNVVEQSRNERQWKGVKYAYYDCRRYGGLQNITIRGTEKIWDSNLMAIAMLWAKQQSDSALDKLIDLAYEPFWKRQLDIEDMHVIENLLDRAGVSHEGFSQWSETAGRDLSNELQNSAFSIGIYGVPTYIVAGEFYFGREHLPRIKWHLSGGSGSAPDIANQVQELSGALPNVESKSVVIGIDDSLDSLLAISPLKTLLDEQGLSATWVAIKSKEAYQLLAATNESRAANHQRYKATTAKDDFRRYAPANSTNDNIATDIQMLLRELEITLDSNCDAEALDSVLPGVVVKIDSEIFIGRQHLPLISRLLED